MVQIFWAAACHPSYQDAASTAARTKRLKRELQEAHNQSSCFKRGHIREHSRPPQAGFIFLYLSARLGVEHNAGRFNILYFSSSDETDFLLFTGHTASNL